MSVIASNAPSDRGRMRQLVTAGPLPALRPVDWRGAARWLWVPLTLLALYVSGGARGAFAVLAFFTLVLLWPATYVVGRLWGRRWELVSAGTCAGLLLLRAPVAPAVPDMQPAAGEHLFTASGELMRHRLRVPAGTGTWNAMWNAPSPPEAYLYLWVTSLNPDALGLVVSLNGRPLGTLTSQTAISPPVLERLPGAPTDGHMRQWHRLRVERAEIDRSPTLQVVVAPPPDFQPAQASGLYAGYSYKPTLGPDASSFFDGHSWRTEPRVILPVPANADGPFTLLDYSRPMRFMIDLRLVDPATQRVLATYY